MLFLVVDDDALSRDLLTLLLEAEGYKVEAVASGEAAIARIKSQTQDGLTLPDVILTDIQMPGLAGNALAAALKPLLAPGTLLLAMSGSQPEASALAGFNGFLLKPFEVSELRSMISHAGGLAAEQERPAQMIAQIDTPEPGALDEEIYSKMCELMPVEQLGQMYALCIHDARKRIGQMKDLAAAEDDAQYRSEAHAVKGGCGMIGASELYQLASAAEQAGLTSTDTGTGTTGVTETLAQLLLACDRLERILAERTRE